MADYDWFGYHQVGCFSSGPASHGTTGPCGVTAGPWHELGEGEGGAGNAGSQGVSIIWPHQNLQNSEILLNFEGCPSFGPDMRVEVVECDHNVVNLSVWLHCFGRHQISDLLHPQICPNHIRFDRHQTRAKNTCMLWRC